MKYYEVRRNATERLEQLGIPDADVDAELILLHSLGMTRAEFFTVMTEEMPAQKQEDFEKLLKRRLDREPLQYILEGQDFMGLDFLVSPDVLIPRLDTEVLAEHAIERARELMGKLPCYQEASAGRCSGTEAVADFTILDMCTGSGCVAISVAIGSSLKDKAGHGIHVTATDVSEPALRMAEKNWTLNKEKAEHKNVSVVFRKSDMFENITESYDMITANPPYVKSGDIDGLMPEVTEHEPRLALDGGEDGLHFYRIIAENASKHLKPGGWILMELDDDEGEAVAELLRQNGFSQVSLIKDLAGLIRVVEGRLIR